MRNRDGHGRFPDANLPESVLLSTPSPPERVSGPSEGCNITLEEKPCFRYRFEQVFNRDTFLRLLQQFVKRSSWKTLLFLDNGPCQNLQRDGRAWFGKNHHRIELFRLPPHSPNVNPTEGDWKQTKKLTTYHRCFHTTDERNAPLVANLENIQSKPTLLEAHVARFPRSRFYATLSSAF